MKELDRFDTNTDVLPTGERRCDYNYKDYDERIDYVVNARCTRPATLRIRVTKKSGEVHDANSCRRCYEHVLPHVGQQGNPAKVEALQVQHGS
jgi:hypothetical protein